VAPFAHTRKGHGHTDHDVLWRTAVATDYPHPDHPGTWVDALGRRVAGLGEATRAAYLGGNIRCMYRL
jgi:hypothetical protein